MKRKRNIRWSDSVGVKQSHKTVFGIEASLPGEFSLFLLCTLFFFGAAGGMLRSVFTWDVFTPGILFRVFLITVIVSGLVELTYYLKPAVGKIARGGIGAGGIAVFAFYLLRTTQGEALLPGFYALTNAYFKKWNSYYGTGLWCPSGDLFVIEKAVGFGVTVICFMVVWWARIRRKTTTAALVPLVVLVSELLIGEVPTGYSLLVFGCGLFLSCGAGYRRPDFLAMPDLGKKNRNVWRQFLWVPLCLGLLGLSAGVMHWGTTTAEGMVDQGSKKLRRMGRELLQEVVTWSVWQEIDAGNLVERVIEEFLYDNEIDVLDNGDALFARIDNEMPEYEEEAVLKVTFDKEPPGFSYLIGFYADTYQDGVWDSDVKAFEQACRKAGFLPETVAKELLTLAPRRIAVHYGKHSLADLPEERLNGWLYYAKANREKAYLPYFSEATEERIRIEGDGRYVKKKNLTKAPFLVWDYEIEELVDVLFRETWQTNKMPWETWYESYVTERYLQVPEAMKQVKKVAGEIKVSGKSYFRAEGKHMVNFDRLNAAYQVADWMQRNTTYSLELDPLPKGRDAIEYFLETGREGYCMHYAGASALILREMGVPARYVSGYVVGGFTQNGTTGIYEATVWDSNAHAWVEIYLEGIGWVPIEVTKGYSVLPEAEMVYRQLLDQTYQVSYEEWTQNTGTTGIGSYVKPELSEGPEQWGNPGMPVGPSGPEESAQIPEDVPEKEEASEVTGEEEAEEPEPLEKEEEKEIANEQKEEKKAKLDLRVNPVVVIFAFPILCIIFGVMVPLQKHYIKKKKISDEVRLQKKTVRWGNRRRIKWINQGLYRKLRSKGVIRTGNLRDEEYSEVIRRHSETVSREERERYMHLVKEARFSFHEFSDEEVAFCQQVYHKVLYDNKQEPEEKE